MLTLKINTLQEIGLDFKHFGPFTYVTISSTSKIVKSAFDKKGVKKYTSRPKQTEFCIAKKLYEANKAKPFFFLEKITREDQFEAVSSKFFKAYQKGTGWKIDFADRHIDLLKVLRSGNFERIVVNCYQNNHTLLNHNGKVVYHCVRIDYCQGGFDGGDYHVDKLAAYLETRKDIKDVDIITIPYYNAEFSGERSVEFTYIPPPSRWNQFCGWYYDDTVSGKWKLFEKLEVFKFKKG